VIEAKPFEQKISWAASAFMFPFSPAGQAGYSATVRFCAV
jgi:hypothetical protein